MADQTMSDQVTELVSNFDGLVDKSGAVSKSIDDIKRQITGLGQTAPQDIGKITSAFDRLLTKMSEYERAAGRVSSAGTLANAANISVSNAVLTGGDIHGYNAMESARHRLATIGAVGGDRESTGGIGIEKAFEAMSNRLRQPVGSVIGAAGAFKAGGLNREQSVAILQRIQNTLTGIQGLQQGSPSYMRRSNLLLSNLVDLSQRQISISGRLTERQVGGMSGMLHAVQGAGIDPSQAGRYVDMFAGAARNPGGGTAGEAFMQRTFGLHGQNMEAYKAEAKKRGIPEEYFKKRDLYEYTEFMETVPSDVATQMQMVAGAVEFGGGGPRHQAYMMKQLTGIPMKNVLNPMLANYQGGGMGSAAMAPYTRGGGTAQADAVGAAPTTDYTSTLMGMTKANNEYYNSVLQFGEKGVPALVTMNRALRDFQMAIGEEVADVFTTVVDGATSVSDVMGKLGTAVTGFATDALGALEIIQNADFTQAVNKKVGSTPPVESE